MALYPARIVKPLPVPHDLICDICTGVLLDPVEGPCEHLTCRKCLDGWLLRTENRTTCPTCRGPLTPDTIKQAHRFIRNRLNELEVTCDNAAHGCAAAIPLGTLNDHVAVCGWAIVPCLNDGCAETTRRQDLEIHSRECPHRIVPCNRCNSPIKHQNEQEHLQHSCPAVELPCQHIGVCGKRVRRDELSTHIDTECSGATVTCQVPGCQQKMARRDLKQHLENSMPEHVASLSVALQQANAKMTAQEAELAALREANEKMPALEAKVEELKGARSRIEDLEDGVADLKNGNRFPCEASFRTHTAKVNKFAAAGAVVYSASSDGSIRVWHLPELQGCIHAIRGDFDRVTDIALYGSMIYGVTHKGDEPAVLRAWRATDYQPVQSPVAKTGIKSVAAYKGKLYCSFADGPAEVYTVGSNVGTPRGALAESDGEYVFVLGENLVLGASARRCNIMMWSTANRAMLHAVERRPGVVGVEDEDDGDDSHDDDVSTDEDHVEDVEHSDSDGYAHYLSPRQLQLQQQQQQLQRQQQQQQPHDGRERRYTALAMGPEYLYSVYDQGNIQVRNKENLKCIDAFEEDTKTKHTCLAAGGDYVFAGTDKGTIQVWGSRPYAKEEAKLGGHTAPVSALLFHNNMLYTGFEDGKIKVWRMVPLHKCTAARKSAPISRGANVSMQEMYRSGQNRR